MEKIPDTNTPDSDTPHIDTPHTDALDTVYSPFPRDYERSYHHQNHSY
jgi:hypothetical protein